MAQAAGPADFAWFTARTGYVTGPDFRGIRAIDPAGRRRGLVGYDHWTPNSAEMHICLDTPAVGRCLLRPAFSYPFEELGLRMLLAFMPANAKSRAMAMTAGFVEHGRVPEGWTTGDDLVLLVLRREDCRFLKGAN